jgi:hypothetical protein
MLRETMKQNKQERAHGSAGRCAEFTRKWEHYYLAAAQIGREKLVDQRWSSELWWYTDRGVIILLFKMVGGTGLCLRLKKKLYMANQIVKNGSLELF